MSKEISQSVYILFGLQRFRGKRRSGKHFGNIVFAENSIFVVITFRVTSPSEFTDFTGKPRFDSITRYCIGGNTTVFIPPTIRWQDGRLLVNHYG